MHELRRIDVLSGIRDRFEIIDTVHTVHGISGRDQKAILKSVSGLLKLLYPDGNVTDDELEEVLLIATELRQRVREQLHLIAPGEYEHVKLGVWLHQSGKKLVPELRDAGRIQTVKLPPQPSIGEVIGLAVAGDHGCILHFEVQVTKGSGKVIPLGSIQRVMRESIEAAAQYVRFKSTELGLGQTWYDDLDVAVLATYMGVPKEGSSAGITIVTGIVSALKKQPVRNDVAMTGEITIMGKVLAVGGIQQKVRAAYDAGVKEVLLPADNFKEVQELPSYILDAIKLTPVQTVDEVLRSAFVSNR